MPKTYVCRFLLALCAITISVGVTSSTAALPSGGATGASCLERAEDTLEAQHQLCWDSGFNSMMTNCTGAAATNLAVCATVPTPVTCTAATVVGVAWCGVSFTTAYNETQSCIEVADAQFHQDKATCEEIATSVNDDPYADPQDVQECTSAGEAEQTHMGQTQ